MGGPGASLGRFSRGQRPKRLLSQLRLVPADLGVDVRLQAGLGWTLRRLYLAGPPAITLAITSYLLFWVPYRLTGAVVKALPASEDVRSTYKLLGGTVLYALWILALAWLWKPWSGLVALLALPALGILGLWIRERWRGASAFLPATLPKDLIRGLRERQHDLAVELRALYERWEKNRNEPTGSG